ncbi:phage virion morphogenesis protein [Ferrimonas senticii]|uniref:phage virion morphogenesis protein n=1 Tax=Ferrimonas senticii TaxID=394566 RepID=UPI00040F1B93|nr:phage virion morphogenesis protein [Ferrimonas senticii]
MSELVLDADRLRKQLQRMTLSNDRRKQLNARVRRVLERKNKQMIRQECGPDGTPWAPRKKNLKKKNAKKLSGAKRDQLRVKSFGDSITVTFHTRWNRILSHVHHYGRRETRTAAWAAKVYRKKNDGPPNRGLARALKSAGYKIRRKNARGKATTKSPPVKWIIANMTERQCVVALKRLRGEDSKQSWTIQLPARPLVGTHDDAVMAEVKRFFKEK